LTENTIIPKFTSHIPFWGGYFTHQGKKISVTNTCTIDSYLFSFWVLSKIIPHFVEKLPPLQETKVLEEIIINIQNKVWN
jgi:hypothetical protein